MKIDFQLSSEVFQALLVGKKICVKTPEYDLNIYPPHYGIFFTQAKIEEMKRLAAVHGVRELSDLLSDITKCNDK